MKTIKWVIITIGESKGSTIEITITIVIKTIIICYLHTSFSLSETDFSRREIGSIFPEESQSQQIRVNEYVDGISPEFCQDNVSSSSSFFPVSVAVGSLTCASLYYTGPRFFFLKGYRHQVQHPKLKRAEEDVGGGGFRDSNHNTDASPEHNAFIT